MGRRILLIEPYGDLSEIIGFYLEELGYQFDLVNDATIAEEDLAKGHYECVLINLDQNSDQWRNSGLRLADRASTHHLPVVMIADHEVAATRISANGWKSLRKPFTVEKLEVAITEAVGA